MGSKMLYKTQQIGVTVPGGDYCFRTNGGSAVCGLFDAAWEKCFIFDADLTCDETGFRKCNRCLLAKPVREIEQNESSPTT